MSTTDFDNLADTTVDEKKSMKKEKEKTVTTIF